MTSILEEFAAAQDAELKQRCEAAGLDFRELRFELYCRWTDEEKREDAAKRQAQDAPYLSLIHI